MDQEAKYWRDKWLDAIRDYDVLLKALKANRIKRSEQMGRFIDSDGKQYYFQSGKEKSLIASKPVDPKPLVSPENPVVRAKSTGPAPTTPPLCPTCGTPAKGKAIVGASRG